MPTYEYECDACGHEFEVFQPMGSEPKKACPSCKKRKARRLISSGGGHIFKGSGFYQTDYRSDSYKKDAQADKESASKSADAKSEGSSEKPKANGDSSKSSTTKKTKKKD